MCNFLMNYYCLQYLSTLSITASGLPKDAILSSASNGICRIQEETYNPASEIDSEQTVPAPSEMSLPIVIPGSNIQEAPI